MKNIVKVGLIGFGTVGAGVAKLLLGDKKHFQRGRDFAVELVKIADLDITSDRGVSIPDGILTTNVDEVLANDDIDIVIEDYPGPGSLVRAGLGRGRTLLGLYEGVPQTRRGQHYGLVPPDKITIFQMPIEAKCRHGTGVVAEIQRVVRHEIAHHFGIGDARLQQLENGEG